MRTLAFGIVGTIGMLLMVDYGAAGHGGRLIGSALRSPSEQTVVRDRKGDRLPVATFAYDQRRRPPDAPPPAPAANPRSDRQPALLKGCEPALSPLTGAALTGLHARCVADAGKSTRLAALH